MSLDWLIPSREGFCITVHDSSKPKGQRSVIPAEYYPKAASEIASERAAQLRAYYAVAPSIKVSLSECIY